HRSREDSCRARAYSRKARVSVGGHSRAALARPRAARVGAWWAWRLRRLPRPRRCGMLFVDSRGEREKGVQMALRRIIAVALAGSAAVSLSWTLIAAGGGVPTAGQTFTVN